MQSTKDKDQDKGIYMSRFQGETKYCTFSDKFLCELGTIQ
jgi:hypothetical protein